METNFLVALLRLCVHFCALPVYLLCYLGLWDPLCKKAFPYFMDSFSVHYNSKMSAKKKDLFSNLSDFASPAGRLTIFEIGTGTGTNFEFYPTGCKVICTDPNPNFQKYLDKNLSKNPHVKLESCIVAAAEDLHQIPDASVDVVVCTLVLCSVKNTARVLSEVLRVLRPGGAFYFMEHVLASPSTWMFFWQQIYDAAWDVFFDGCCLTRESGKELEKAGFSDLKLRYIDAPLNWNPAKPHIIGYAVK
uniref:Methyltransferase type 11 domain-containing protein n=1 Tax=Anolis carolinensis TaxID=28377 RepID=G1KTN5_ANOCA|nr:PREDICTED: methyltransferase-like protein 7A [Anolis carolinensis]|eukprot:XP_003216973.1 PREDICTED: methyltransferase-like protein 7A [Anolis carolinensis]